MNETQFVDVVPADLVVGDVLTGSGFLVRVAPKATDDGRIRVIGNHPLSPNSIRYFSPTQKLTVRRLTTAL